MKTTDNYRKHTTKSRAQKFLINRFYSTLLSVVYPLKVKTILDVGCGEGFTLQYLFDNKIGQHLDGVDFLKTAIDIGRKVHPKLKLNVDSIYNLKCKDNSFDLVLCTEVLEHLDDPKKALQELVRVSRKYILLSVPNEPFFMGANFLRGKNLSRWGNDIEHINHWTSGGFEKFVQTENVCILATKHPFPWTLLLLEKNTS